MDVNNRTDAYAVAAAAEAGITVGQARAVAKWMDRYPSIIPTPAKSEAPRSVPLVDFDLAVFAPAPPSPPSTALTAATVERALDAIRAEFRAAEARLRPSGS